jgi:bd-type cytochrome oxidase subunit I
VNVLELSRWQFGITTVYHFLFVPITIGLAFLVAGFETAWLRSGDDQLRHGRGHRHCAGIPVRHETGRPSGAITMEPEEA